MTEHKLAMPAEELKNPTDFKHLPENVSLIALGHNRYAIVDTEDLRRLSRFRWSISKNKSGYYARRHDGEKSVYMHHEVLSADGAQEIDHINCNGCDNRQANLRTCTHQQNTQNSRSRKNCTSRFKGVSWDKNKKKWTARIGHNGKKIHLGYFESELDAAAAYDARAKVLFGEFGRLNFPEVSEKQAKDEKVLCMQKAADYPWLF